jgi:peptide/nickel transport system substrate-binding protein
MRFRKPIVALSVTGLLALAACGGDGGGSSNDGSDAVDRETLGNVGSGQDPEREGPVEIEGAQEGGIATVYTQVGLTTSIDPSDLYYTDTSAIGSGLLFRSLTQYDRDPETGQMILIPDLATDLGTPNEDFTEWTFEIRDGVRWETGEEVTAEDVAYGIIRSMDNKTFPGGPGLYFSNPYFLGGDKYDGPFTSGTTEQEAVSVDGNKVIVKMSKPFPDFPYYGSFPAMGPIPEGEDDPDEYALRPMSTGPYKIKEYTPSKTLVLERNPEWDPATDPGRTQYPDGYDFKAGVQIDQIDQIMLGDQGEGQTSMTYEDISAQTYRTMQNEAPDRVVTGTSPCTYYYAPDYRKIKDIEIREALMWALPYNDLMVTGGYIPEVNAFPASQLMAPGVAGRVDIDLFGHGEFETDPEKAKQLLEESGNLGYEIKFPWRTDNDLNTKSKDVLIKALEAAGFKATPVATTEAKFEGEIIDNPDSEVNVRSGMGWCQDWPSGSTWIPPVFQSVDIEELGQFGTNYAAFSEPEVDRKIEEVFELPAEEQADAWGALEEEIMTKYLPIIPYFHSGVVVAHGSKIEGYEIDNNLGQPAYKDIWVAE